MNSAEEFCEFSNAKDVQSFLEECDVPVRSVRTVSGRNAEKTFLVSIDYCRFEKEMKFKESLGLTNDIDKPSNYAGMLLKGKNASIVSV